MSQICVNCKGFPWTYTMVFLFFHNGKPQGDYSLTSASLWSELYSTQDKKASYH